MIFSGAPLIAKTGIWFSMSSSGNPEWVWSTLFGGISCIEICHLLTELKGIPQSSLYHPLYWIAVAPYCLSSSGSENYFFKFNKFFFKKMSKKKKNLPLIMHFQMHHPWFFWKRCFSSDSLHYLQTLLCCKEQQFSKLKWKLMIQ